MKKSGFFDPVRARRQRVLMRLLPFGLVLSGVSGMAMAQPACPSPANEVGVQFPGGFISQYQRRIIDKGSRYSHALLFSSR